MPTNTVDFAWYHRGCDAENEEAIRADGTIRLTYIGRRDADLVEAWMNGVRSRLGALVVVAGEPARHKPPKLLDDNPHPPRTFLRSAWASGWLEADAFFAKDQRLKGVRRVAG